MDELQQEQFTKALLGLVDLAKTKKNVLQYGEINDAFKGLELTEKGNIFYRSSPHEACLRR